ncbi:MAG: isoprenyl transferase [Bacteroidales bacterium]|nr:isoprenyl transferase [Bacteroidales bacterium]
MQLSDLDTNLIPQHVAIIMDGNGRWAQHQKKRRIFGHQNAMDAVRAAIEAAVASGVKYLTLYTFSTENWNRPQEEIDGLMELLVKAIHDETSTMMKNNVSLSTIGDLSRLPDKTLAKLEECCRTTSVNTGTSVILALSYSSRWEVAEALKAICRDAAQGRLTPDQVDQETLRSYLATADYPDPDLLIRTGGELRLSNFLLWQMAYTEFYFSDQLWPDFRHSDFYEALHHYQQRQRRYGLTGDQVETNNAKK